MYKYKCDVKSQACVCDSPTQEEEEEPVDHQEVLREKCGELAKCSNLKEKLDTCNERVSGKSSTTEDCSEELFDFMHCVDHCVSIA